MSFRFKDKERPAYYVCHCASALHVCLTLPALAVCKMHCFNFYGDHQYVEYYYLSCVMVNYLIVFQFNC